jgi:hypothetical protein
MSNVDDVLDQCLTDLFTGASTLEECLARYPEYALQLEPLLQTASRVGRGSRVQPAPAFKVRARSRLISHMQTYPRREVSSRSPFWRMMPGLIAILLTLFVTGTVYAQGVLPGDPFYAWKLTSEHAWRMVSPDSVKTDLRIANRRINEMNVTINDHAKWARALEGYSEVRSRLEFEIDPKILNNILPPADSFSYPGNAILTPGSGNSQGPSTEDKDKSKDEDQKDKDNQDKGKEDNGGNKNKESGSNSPAEPIISSPTAMPPNINPNIEIPPPIN